ncbi:heterokaryon incompatibility protein-domain-containing protein [Fusarium solani]|uniref:Heterokaryon incompatibility protein-domain-containing protein n=1 Tax=Fusarium solani TaxID=169388 RepID=A0A9P9HJ60_FUSSL|nr:heterokaryon incompatibility protein-domain-containing protein [Fusarium solani]KAH7258565.1 heterokaryon incompatibility protein-domain-containing protein [Fusarium solani]
MSTQEANPTGSGSCSTRLCERCQGACFDDSRNGGSIALSQGVEEMLEFPSNADSYYSGNGAILWSDFELRDWLPALPALSASAECDFCCFLRSAIMDSKIGCQVEEQEICLKLFYAWWPENSDLGFALYGMCLEISRPGEEDALQVLRFTIDSQDEQCQRWLRVQPTPSLDFLNQEKISEMSAKLDKFPPSYSDFSPTRVIDLGADPEGEELKLVTKHECLDQQYAALSYCWGTPEEAEMQFITLRCNLQNRYSGFKLSEVSPVIKDAVVVCRAFGVRYLWVDAVCIIQDDDYDWEQESALMAMIFRDAYFVIATPASDSCNEGFLSLTKPFIHLPFQSKLKPGIQGPYRLVPIPNHENSTDQATFARLAVEDYFASRWRTRGWIYQEKVTAQRILLFGRMGLSVQFHQDDGTPFFAHCAERHLNYRGWFRIVAGFSDTHLTCQTDRLPAISGLAKLHQDVLQDEYLAGLWRNDLYKGLFWQSEFSNRPRQELTASLESPDPYIAPSWSWARQDYPVSVCLAQTLDLRQEFEVLQQEFTLLDVEMDLVGSNPYGQLRSGKLTLRSRASEIPSSWDFVDELDFLDDEERIQLRPDWNWFIEGKGNTEGLTLFLLGSCIMKRRQPCYCHELGVNEGNLSDEILDNANAKEEQALAGLGALDLGDSDHVEEHDQQLCLHCKKQLIIYGLLLRPAKEPGKFFRVGIFVSDPNTHVLGGMSLCQDWETRTVEII